MHSDDLVLQGWQRSLSDLGVASMSVGFWVQYLSIYKGLKKLQHIYIYIYKALEKVDFWCKLRVHKKSTVCVPHEFSP